IVVHLYDCVTFSSVSSFCSCFHQLDCTLLRNDVGKFEECGLQNGVDTSAKTDLFTDLDTVDHIEFDSMVCDECFHLSRKVFLQSFHIPGTVQQEGTAVNQLLNHVVFV